MNSPFTNELTDISHRVDLMFQDFRKFANEHTSIHDPLHQARVKTKELLNSPRFRDLPRQIDSLAKEVDTLEAQIKRGLPEEELAEMAKDAAAMKAPVPEAK